MSSRVDTTSIGHLSTRLLKRVSSASYTASQRWPSVARPILGTILPVLARSRNMKALFRRHIIRFGNLVGYQLLETVPLLNGMTLEVVRGTCDGESIVSDGVYEIETVNMLQRIVSPGMVFLDIGANVGQYTLIASSLVGKSGRVYAVEPLPQIADVLRKNVARNVLTNVIVSQRAISNSDKESQFHVSCPISIGTSSLFENMYSSGSNITVQCQTLKTYAREMQLSQIDVMKLDVEGAEFGILDGCRDMFQGASAPILFVEINDYMLRRAGRSARELLELLQELSYCVFPLAGGLTDAQPLRSADLAGTQEAEAFNALAWPLQKEMPVFIAALKAGLSR